GQSERVSASPSAGNAFPRPQAVFSEVGECRYSPSDRRSSFCINSIWRAAMLQYLASPVNFAALPKMGIDIKNESLISLLEGMDSFISPFSVKPTLAAVRTICAYRGLPVRSASSAKTRYPARFCDAGRSGGPAFGPL